MRDEACSVTVARMDIFPPGALQKSELLKTNHGQVRKATCGPSEVPALVAHKVPRWVMQTFDALGVGVLQSRGALEPQGLRCLFFKGGDGS